MSETSGTQTDPGRPRVTTEQMRDLDRLRRSRSDRYIAGVAGGLGRHFDVDPTVVRVLLVVLAFFGGAGLLLYGAVWLLVPEDGQDSAPIEVRSDLRKALVIAAAVIAGLIFLGTTFSDQSWGFGFPLPLIVLAIIAVVVLLARDRRDERREPPTPWASTPTAGPAPGAQEGTTMSVTDTPPPAPGAPGGAPTAPAYGQAPPAWAPPTPPAYVPPPRPRRTGMVLFWPTLALIAIALGTIGVVDTSASVPAPVYAAVALAITGLMLVVGAFTGRPGGLIALGVIGSIILGLSQATVSATGGHPSGADLDVAPNSAALVADDYSVSNGTIVVDLTRVSNVAALDGRSVRVHLNAGQITVKVPSTMTVEANADIRYAGSIEIGGQTRDGFSPTLSGTLEGPASADTPTLNLQVDARVGHISVQQN